MDDQSQRIAQLEQDNRVVRGHLTLAKRAERLLLDRTYKLERQYYKLSHKLKETNSLNEEQSRRSEYMQQILLGQDQVLESMSMVELNALKGTLKNSIYVSHYGANMSLESLDRTSKLVDELMCKKNEKY